MEGTNKAKELDAKNMEGNGADNGSEVNLLYTVVSGRKHSLSKMETETTRHPHLLQRSTGTQGTTATKEVISL